jgi:DNA-binding LytR/AlgR family response regulator
MKISSIIVEDLQPSADFLMRFCERSGMVDVHQHCEDAEQALAYLSGNLVDLIFLDVEMPGLNGFQMLDQLVYQPQVILTTSKEEYAYNAFEYRVADFLKKPFSYQRFMDAVQKVEKQRQQQQEAEENQTFIKVNGKLVRLKYDDILYMESMGDYVKFVTADKKYIALNTMKNLEQKFCGQQFCKVHRSYIVNLSAIDDIQENTLYIKGSEIPVSKSNKSLVLQKINVL